MPTVDERLASLETKVDAIAHLQSAISEFRAEMNRQFEQVDQRFDEVDRRFEQVERRFEQVDDRHGGLVRRLEILDQRMERHFMWMVGIQFTVLLAVIVALIQLSPR